MRTGTESPTYHLVMPCRDPLVEDDEGCEVGEWIRTDGLSTGFLWCDRHDGFAGHISWPQLRKDGE